MLTDGATILVADDERHLRESLAELFPNRDIPFSRPPMERK